MYTDALHLLGLLFYQFEGNTKSAIQHLRAAVLSQSQLRYMYIMNYTYRCTILYQSKVALVGNLQRGAKETVRRSSFRLKL